jgi:hypothetical protein
MSSTSAFDTTGADDRQRLADAGHPLLVREFTEYLAETFGCTDIVDLTSEQDHTPQDPSRALPVCREPGLSESFVSAMDSAPAGLVVCDPGPSTANPAELRNALARRGLQAPLAGWSPAPDLRNSGRQLLAVVTGRSTPPLGPARENFRVVAFLPTYNESDIISHTLQYLTGQGIQVYLIDNWSTDDTLARARRFSGRGLIGMERFPADGPVPTYEWRQILGRVEDLAEQLAADWFVLHDADERRQSPWLGVDVRTGLHHVDRCGFTCVDHVVANFWPTGDTVDPARDVEGQLRYFSFSDHPGHYHQRKAWKNCGCRVSLAASAGHDVRFPGRRVYPFKFLLKHYPIRSEEHGRRKVLADRAPRWNREERALGWHRQYEDVMTAGTFLRDAATLQLFEAADFSEQYFVERLSGIGVFHARPAWATGPRDAC